MLQVNILALFYILDILRKSSSSWDVGKLAIQAHEYLHVVKCLQYFNRFACVTDLLEEDLSVVVLIPPPESKVHLTNESLIIFKIDSNPLEICQLFLNINNLDGWHVCKVSECCLELSNRSFNATLNQIINTCKRNLFWFVQVIHEIP